MSLVSFTIVHSRRWALVIIFFFFFFFFFFVVVVVFVLFCFFTMLICILRVNTGLFTIFFGM